MYASWLWKILTKGLKLCDKQPTPLASLEWLRPQPIFQMCACPQHALISFIIILYYLWVPLPLKNWRVVGLADILRCSMHSVCLLWMQRGNPLKRHVSLALRLCLSSSLLLLLFFDTSNNFWLKSVTVLTTHTSMLSLSILSLFSHNPLNRFIKLEMEWNWGENECIPLDRITSLKKKKKSDMNCLAVKREERERKQKICCVSL